MAVATADIASRSILFHDPLLQNVLVSSIFYLLIERSDNRTGSMACMQQIEPESSLFVAKIKNREPLNFSGELLLGAE